jgi:pseudomonalisin
VLPTSGNASAHAYYPQEFATAYHAGTTPAASNTTVAIIGWGSMTNAVNDLKQFESGQGLAAVPTSIVSTTTQSSTDDSGQAEWGMDAQAIVGISGGVKSLIFYTDGGTYNSVTGTSSGASDSGILQVINQAVSDNTAKVVNMSWGEAECDEAPSFADSAFKLGVTQGQTFSASSGDNGSYPCNASANGAYGDKSKLSAIYPASSPYVVSVGGTTLNTSTSDAYISEAAWPYSGGGISVSESTPAWQSSSYLHREVPDVAFDADWTNSPVIAYFTKSSTSGVSQSGNYTNGGTSLSSPLFVGAWARLETANNNSRVSPRRRCMPMPANSRFTM